MNSIATGGRTQRLVTFGCVTLAGVLAAVALGTPSWGMNRPSAEPRVSDASRATGVHIGIYTGGARPGAYLLVKTPTVP